VEEKDDVLFIVVTGIRWI